MCYHESWHSALAHITKRHVLQIVDTRLRIIGCEGLSIIPYQLASSFWKITLEEKIYHLLVWLAIQWILEKNKKYKLWEEMIRLHWDKSSNQSDISRTLKLIRKKHWIFPLEQEQKIIENIIQKIQIFLERQPKLKKFIARLAYVNQRQNLLLPEHIREAADYAGVDSNEKKRLRTEINKLNLLDFSSFSSPLSSQE